MSFWTIQLGRSPFGTTKPIVSRGEGGKTRTMSPVIAGELSKSAVRHAYAPSQMVMGSPGRSRRARCK